MPVFQILGYRRGSGENFVEFDVQFRSGDLVAGDKFYCYDTHHPVPYSIRAVRREGQQTILLYEGEFCYDDAFVRPHPPPMNQPAPRRRPSALLKYKRD